MCCMAVEIERESTKYKGKHPCAGFCAKFIRFLSDTYHWSFELSKCSLKYEPSVFNINTNVKDGISAPALVLTLEL